MKASLLTFIACLVIGFTPLALKAQTVFDPNDNVVEYNPFNPPAQPASGPGKWVRTTRTLWNTSSFKCYIYKGMAFRLKYPKSYVPGNGKRYPLFLSLHHSALGGTIYDNEAQLLLGAENYGSFVDNNKFDGFVFCPQSKSADGFFSIAEYDIISEVIENLFVPQIQVDPFRVSVTGISGGGGCAWRAFIRNPKLFASTIVISNAEYYHASAVIANKFNAVWLFQGTLDINPPPVRARVIRDSAVKSGANFIYNEYADLGHNCWEQAWVEPNFFPFLNGAHKANPWSQFGRTDFCSEDSVNQLLGVTAGFNGYEWRKNGELIEGASSNIFIATSFGTYDCRVKRGNEWSPWSPVPIVLKSKSNSISPDPKLAALASKVLPAPDGSITVQLKVDEGYIAYKWTAEGSSVALGTGSTFVAAPGSYQVSTTERFSCQSIPSNPFTVVDANGPNKPPAVVNLVANPLSENSLKLIWIADGNAPNAATNFEIYQARSSGGPYQFIGITGSGDRNYTAIGLTSGTKYFYAVRAVNNSAAANLSNEVSVTTQSDVSPPSSPSNLQVTGTTRSSISLRWNAATDNRGIAKYDIYIDGAKISSTSATVFTAYNLDYNKVYTVTVKARDLSGNESNFSNQASARTLVSGLVYKYYIGDWDRLPNFSLISLQGTGFVPNVTLANRTQEEKFAYLWEGSIRIPVDGSYTFRTNSDDGSRLYINTPYSSTATPLVDNDGVHGPQDRDGTINLSAGIYNIAISYFQKITGYGINVSWKTPQTGNTFVPIPDEAFAEPTVAAENIPIMPSALSATPVSFNKVNLTWADNSNNETGFELFRSPDPAGSFVTVAVLGTNTSAFQDTSVTPGTTYYYRVRAINQNGESAYDRTGNGAGQEFVSATTPAKPQPPAIPGNLNVAAVGISTASIAWSNDDGNATNFEIYRSYNNNQDYIFVTSIPAGNTSYTDAALFANATIYYKVRSVGSTGSSDFSNEIVVHTLGVSPSLDFIEDQYMRFDSQLRVYVNATTSIPQNLTLQVNNLPGFASFATTGNGKGVITFAPGANNQGSYNGISVTVSNSQNNTASRSFNLVVNDNYVPQVSGQTSISVNENQAQQISFSAIDSDATDVLSWSFIGLPGFITVVPNNRTVQLNIAPVSGNAGIYNIIARADDGRNGRDTIAFSVIINGASIGASTYIHLSPSSGYIAGGVWNSIGKVLAPNELYPASANPGFKDQNGIATNMRLSINFELGLTTVSNFSGMKTGVNSGVYPDKVLQGGYRFGWNKPYIVSFSGLESGHKYNFTFLGSFSSTSNGDVSTRYRINADSVLLNSLRNTQNTVTLNNVMPNADGTLSLNVSRGPSNGTSYYYINAIVISDANTPGPLPPARLNDFQLKYESGAAKLSWTNTTSIVTGNEVYRSSVRSGPYTLLNPGSNNATAQAYTDSTIYTNSNYYYFVKAVNSYGGTSTDTLGVFIPNKAPVITSTEAFLKTGQPTNISVQATDNAGDVITLKATGLPPFVIFTDNGNGNGRLTANPLAGNTGMFTATVTATDNAGESTSATVKLYITDNAISSTYVNFNATIPVAGIWNSFNKTPVANASLTGLKNDLGVSTTAAVTLTSAWVYGATGAVTGSNIGAFRDDVLQTYYAETTTATKTVRITGLSTDASIHYNLVFMSSSAGVMDDRTTIFSSGGKTVSINAAGNTQKAVQINDLTANGGVIEYTVTKGANALGAYMNALVIQSYVSSSTLLSPDKFRATGISKDSIKLAWNSRTNGGSIEIYRSLSANGNFNFVTAVDGNAGGYTDFGLQPNTEYFYKLKAVSAPNVSPFSNTISASTYAYSVYINFNRDNPAALPWNNTNSDPQAGTVHSFLFNDLNNSSGIIMTVGSGFSGTNANGENTGNNSGVVPDNVMRSVWWADIGQYAQLKFSGLSQNFSYSFTFFASRTAADTRITSYIINGRVVKLQVNNNRTRTITMDNIFADANGEVLLTIQPEIIATQYSYIGGLIISGAKKPSDPIEGTGGAVFRGSIGGTTDGSITDADLSTTSKLQVYPNPFRDDVMVKLNLAHAVSKLVIKVTDASGRMVLTREYANVPRGSWLQSAGLDKQKLPAGVYFIQVQGLNSETLAPIRVLKTK